MKIKSSLKNKKNLSVAVASLGVVAILGGGYYLTQKKDQEFTSPNGKSNISSQDTEQNQPTQEKSSNKETQTSTTPTNQTKTMTYTSLSDLSLQALKDPTGGTITLSLYGPQGTYDVDKCINYQSGQCLSGWLSKVSAQSYPGHGGLSVDVMGANETKATYLAYKIENGKRVGASKPMVVDRSLINNSVTISGG